MVLQNYWAYLKYTGTYTNQTTIGVAGMTEMGGNAIANAQTASITQAYANYGLGIQLSLVLGTGTTEPQATDYALEQDVTSLLNSSTVQIYGFDSKKITFQLQATATNNTGSDIDITEIGIRKIFRGSVATTPSSYGDMYVLLTREVLEEPITIAAGETKTIDYVWTMK